MDRILNSGSPMKHSIAVLVLFTNLICGAVGCRASEASHATPIPEAPAGGCVDTVDPESAAQAPLARSSPTLAQDMAVRAPQSEMTREGQELFAYLLLVQAILAEDEAALLEAAGPLGVAAAPPGVWLDGAVWLMSRKSPNTIVYLEQALKSHPEDISINLLYAEALGEHGMAARGVESMREYLKRHPDDLDGRLQLALLLVKDKKFDEAQKILNGISPKERTYLVDFNQALALLGMERRAEAIPYLKKAVRERPDFVEALAELAFAQEQEGNLREARSAYEKLQKLGFSPRDVALRLINLSLRLKQPEKAVQYIRKGPESLQFRLAAVNMLMEARHYLQAENILKQIASSGHAPVDVYLLLAELVYEQRHNLPMALDWLNKIPAHEKGAAKVAIVRSQLLAEAGKSQDALQEIEAAAQKFPDNADLRELEIRILARDKKLPQALKQAAAARKQWPQNASIGFLYGSLLDESGDRAKAMEIMEEVLKQDAANYQAMNYIGFTLADQGKELDRALELLRKADELSPDQAYIVDSLAWAHFKLGHGAEALKEIRRAINLGGSADAAIWEHYGDIAHKQGKKDEARRAYRRALDLKPDNAAAIRAKLSKL